MSIRSCPQCRAVLRGGWSCCPQCGAEVAEGTGSTRQECDHEFVVVGPHCVHCGFKSRMGKAFEGPLYWLVSLGAIVLGGVVIALGGLMVRSPPGSRITAADIFIALVGGGLIVYGIVQIFRGAGNIRVMR